MRARQNGTATVEFAFVGLAFLLLMLGVLEFGRMMFVWNAVADATRLGARAAAVCPPAQDAVIKGIARYDPSGAGTGLFPAGLTPATLVLTYLDAAGNPLAAPTGAAAGQNVRWVRMQVQGYQYQPLLPGLGPIAVPAFTTTVPRESLGVVPITIPAERPVNCIN